MYHAGAESCSSKCACSQQRLGVAAGVVALWIRAVNTPPSYDVSSSGVLLLLSPFGYVLFARALRVWLGGGTSCW